ncbi:hypothetical protein AB0O31_18285 [Kitasatospora cineracea]|uniref:hypothetical protein n=1 Tax=Kitasatospora cineracea TaxID=88074 RepID=UPI003435C8E4
MDPDPDLELSAMMETCVKDLSVPVSVIVAESGRRGRRRQAARRLRIAGTALTVAAIAFAGASAGLPLISAEPRTGANAGPADRTRPLTAPVPAATTSPDPGPDPAATGTAATGDRWKPIPLPAAPQLGGTTTETVGPTLGFTTNSVLKDLDSLMPTYHNRFAPAPGFTADRPAGASTVHLTYADEAGPVALELSLRFSKALFPANGTTPAPELAPFRCGSNSGTSDNDEESCFSGYRLDGSWEMVAVNDAQVPGLFGYRVVVWRPDGVILDFTEYAGTVTPKGEPVRSGRYRPPLDLTFWRSVTESPVWNHYFGG